MRKYEENKYEGNMKKYEENIKKIILRNMQKILV